MALGARLRSAAGCGFQHALPHRRLLLAPLRGPCRPQRPGVLKVRASADSGGAAPAPDNGPQEVSLVRRFPGVGYTFMLAGALKIMTVGWIATGAPRECVRTAAGQYGQFLLLPIGLLLCFIAKKIVDAGLHENGRFMTFVLGLTAFAYVGLYPLFYR